MTDLQDRPDLQDRQAERDARRAGPSPAKGRMQLNLTPETESAVETEYAQQPDPMLRQGRLPWTWIIGGAAIAIILASLLYGMNDDGTSTTPPGATTTAPPATTSQVPPAQPGGTLPATTPSGTTTGTGTPTPPAATPGAADVPPARPLDNAPAAPPAGSFQPSTGTTPPQANPQSPPVNTPPQ